MNKFEAIRADFYRTVGKPLCIKNLKHLFFKPALRYQIYSRLLPQNSVTRILLWPLSSKYGLEFTANQIGGGLFVGHPYGITINPMVKVGKFCNIAKGVTIGQENRGDRKGVPTIGNCVWIGVNATVVGNIVVGDDVLIAPNSYVNCNIPSHSIVIGNPCKIIERNGATEDYIVNVRDSY